MFSCTAVVCLMRAGPDLGLGKLGSCPGASTTRGLHNQGPPQPGGLHNQGASTTRGLHNQGPPQPGASTTRGLHNQGPPQPGASTTRGLHNQGPPQPGGLHNQGPPQPGASTTRGLHNQGASTTRGLHNQGASTYVLSTLILWYSTVGWATTAPLLKAAQRPPQPGGLHVCLVNFNIVVFYGRVGLHSPTTEGCTWASTCLNPALNARAE